MYLSWVTEPTSMAPELFVRRVDSEIGVSDKASFKSVSSATGTS